jgi:hypothetical protein
VVTSKDANSQVTEVLYDIEIGLWEADMSTLIYDEEYDCFRFEDGQFAFSKSSFHKGAEVSNGADLYVER